MSVTAFIADTAARLGFTDMFHAAPAYDQHIELFLPAEFPRIKSYIEFEFVRGLYVLHSAEFGPLPPFVANNLPSLLADRVKQYGDLNAAVLINPTLDIAEVPGILFVRSYQAMYWRDAAQSVLSAPKVFKYAELSALPA